MKNGKSIFEIIEESYQMILREIYNNPDKIRISLLYVSNTYDKFHKNLYNNYGIAENKIIEYIAFEIYTEILQKEYRVNSKTLSLSSFLKKAMNVLDDNNLKNIKKNKFKPYMKKYKYLYFDNDMPEKIDVKLMVPLWERLTHYRSIFQRAEIDTMFSLEQGKGSYSISEFQSYLYSYIICNYTERNKILAKLLNMNFSKIDYLEYMEFINDLMKQCKDEEHKGILYYFVEKEFNPILVANTMKRLNRDDKEEMEFRIIYNLWFVSLTPFTILVDDCYDKIKEEMDSIGELQKKYNRYPNTFIIVLLRLHKEFLPYMISRIYRILEDTFKESLNTVLKDHAPEFLEIYSNFEIKVEESLESLKGQDFQRIFKTLMCIKETVYKQLEELVTLIDTHNDKVIEYEKTRDEDVLLEVIYLQEDIMRIVQNNIYLRILYLNDGG